MPYFLSLRPKQEGKKKQNMCKIKFQVSQSIIRYRAFNVLEASNKLLCEGFEIYSFSSEIIKTELGAGRLPSSFWWNDPGWKYWIQRALVGLVFWSRTGTISPIHSLGLQMCWSGISRLDLTASILFKALGHANRAMKDCKSRYCGSEVHRLPLQWICASATETVIIWTFTDWLQKYVLLCFYCFFFFYFL